MNQMDEEGCSIMEGRGEVDSNCWRGGCRWADQGALSWKFYTLHFHNMSIEDNSDSRSSVYHILLFACSSPHISANHEQKVAPPLAAIFFPFFIFFSFNKIEINYKRRKKQNILNQNILNHEQKVAPPLAAIFSSIHVLSSATSANTV